jgi:hypothetical protein
MSFEISRNYTAFISFRHAQPDDEWAYWLHQAIERYRTPRDLVARLGLAPRCGTVFRDQEELAATASLPRAVDEALIASKWLIVVASPRAAHSQWVNAEIRRFHEIGRGERILTLLIDDEPARAFPPALQQVYSERLVDSGRPAELFDPMPLAADVRPRVGVSARRARALAKIKLVATLLGCPFDTLWQRERRRARRWPARSRRS